MPKKQLSSRSGVTLIEVTLAMAIFSVVIAVSSQAIISNFTAVQMQKDRVTAFNSCRVVLNAIREKKGEYRGTNESDLVNWAGFFTWVNGQNTAKWSTYLTEVDGTAALKTHTVTVELRNSTTGATAIATDNPIEVHVIASWKGARDRTMTTRIVSRISDR